MTVPPTEPNADDVPEPDDPEELVPEGDRAAQQENAWPDDEGDDIVPDADRVVPAPDEE
jgi:hypothetical protein